MQAGDWPLRDSHDTHVLDRITHQPSYPVVTIQEIKAVKLLINILFYIGWFEPRDGIINSKRQLLGEIDRKMCLGLDMEMLYSKCFKFFL